MMDIAEVDKALEAAPDDEQKSPNPITSQSQQLPVYLHPLCL